MAGQVQVAQALGGLDLLAVGKPGRSAWSGL